ncbi:hypothetical protein PMIN04_011247 [Paraphaeosphaeria minitans]
MQDDDGTTYLAGSFDGKTMLQAPLDFETDEVLAPLVSIWNGAGLPSPKAPHVNNKNGRYNLEPYNSIFPMDREAVLTSVT